LLRGLLGDGMDGVFEDVAFSLGHESKLTNA
jgi:hypothetical protein